MDLLDELDAALGGIDDGDDAMDTKTDKQKTTKKKSSPTLGGVTLHSGDLKPKQQKSVSKAKKTPKHRGDNKDVAPPPPPQQPKKKKKLAKAAAATKKKKTTQEEEEEDVENDEDDDHLPPLPDSVLQEQMRGAMVESSNNASGGGAGAVSNPLQNQKHTLDILELYGAIEQQRMKDDMMYRLLKDEEELQKHCLAIMRFLRHKVKKETGHTLEQRLGNSTVRILQSIVDGKDNYMEKLALVFFALYRLVIYVEYFVPRNRDRNSKPPVDPARFTSFLNNSVRSASAALVHGVHNITHINNYVMRCVEEWMMMRKEVFEDENNDAIAMRRSQQK